MGTFDGFFFGFYIGLFEAQEESVVVNFVVAHFQLVHHIEGFLFRVFFVFGRAVKYAGATTGTVFHRYLYGKFKTGEVGFAVGRFKSLGSIFQGFSVVRFNADSGVRADQGAETALDTSVGVPLGYHNSNVAFFVLGGTGGIYTAFGHSGGRQVVAAAGNHFAQNVFYKRRGFRRNRGFGVQFRGYFGRIFYFLQARQGGIHGFVVLLHHFFAFFGIGFLNGFFNVGDGFFGRDYTRNTEEGRLHNGIGAAAHTGSQGNIGSVNDVHFQFAVNDNLLYFGG